MTVLKAIVEAPGRLERLILEARAGERIALIGPNGSGKTSALRAMAGVEPPSCEVTICGDKLSGMSPALRRTRLAFLPASRDVTWPIAVGDVVALGLDRPDPARVADLLASLDLQALANRPIVSLSTGERARALLARALAPRPKLLLLDEPLSNLDPAWALRILDLLDAVAMEGAVIMLALHDLAHLDRFDRVLLFHEGRRLCDGPPAAVLGSTAFRQAFGIVRDGAGWRLTGTEDRQSSP